MIIQMKMCDNCGETENGFADSNAIREIVIDGEVFHLCADCANGFIDDLVSDNITKYYIEMLNSILSIAPLKHKERLKGTLIEERKRNVR